MKQRGSLLRYQNPTIGTYPEADKCNSIPRKSNLASFPAQQDSLYVIREHMF